MKLAQIWRYPIKSHGSENLNSIDIYSGKTLPLDRNWAVVHDQSDADGSSWVPCRNFSRVAKAPQLAAISTTWTSDKKLELSSIINMFLLVNLFNSRLMAFALAIKVKLPKSFVSKKN